MFVAATKRAIAHPSTLLLASTAATTVLGIVSASVQARVLGPSGRGVLATAMVPGTLVAMLLCFGLPDFVSRKAAQGENLGTLSKFSLWASLAIGSIAFVPYALLCGFQAPVGTSAWWLLIAYACTLPLYVYGYCLAWLTGGSGHWRSVSAVRLAPSVLSVIAILVLAIAFPPATPLGVGLILIGLTACCPLLYLFHKPAVPRGRVEWTMFRHAASFGARGWPAGTIALVNQRIDLLMMTMMAAHVELGYYAVATTLAAVLNAVANAIAMPARNRVARGDHSLVPAITAATILAVLVLAIAVSALLPLLVQVLLGPKFLPAVPVMTLLLLMQVPLAGVVVLTQSLIAAGHPGAPLGGEVVALVTTVILILIFFPTYGLAAAAVGTGIGNALSFAVLLILARRHLGSAPIWRYIFVSPRELYGLVRHA